MFELKSATKEYDGQRVLGPIDLALRPGATTVLLGSSGSGKSTVLKLMLGLIAPTSGAVEFRGRTVSQQMVGELRRAVGYVVQEGGLFPHLTARQNVELVARRLGWSNSRRLARVDELAALAQLDPSIIDRYPRQLSGGQRQRVGLMRALMLDPGILLLDEPLGALDPIVRADLQAELHAIIEGLGKTAVLVTHDIHEASVLGEEIVLLRRGLIEQAGALEALRDQPKTEFVRRFFAAQGGTPS